MSEKIAKQELKKRPSKVLLFFSVLFGIVILEIIAISCSIFAVESKNRSQITQMDNMATQISRQQAQIQNLQRMPELIQNNAQRISVNTGNLRLYAENLDNLKEEVGNRKIDAITQQIKNLSHSIEVLNELKSEETLILSVALLVKENALYQRSFAVEADVLASLGKGKSDISSAIDVINSMKNQTIFSDSQLINRFNDISKNFNFMTESSTDTSQVSEENNPVSKSIALIKDTVSGINFDKIVVVKKNNITPEQKQLIEQLSQLVNNQNFKGAISFIRAHSDFQLLQNQDLAIWLADAERKLSFDEAISKIIVAELDALRQNIASSQTSIQPK